MSEIPFELTPRLVVRRADDAIAFYRDVFGAELLERYQDDTGAVVHAALRLGASVLSLTEENALSGLRAPSGERTSHLLHLSVPDPDAICASAAQRGARVLIPIEDRDYGKREGRVQDPFGHFWILSRPLRP